VETAIANKTKGGIPGFPILVDLVRHLCISLKIYFAMREEIKD